MIDFDFFDTPELEELFVATPEEDDEQLARDPWEAMRRSLCGAEEPNVVWERMLQGSSLASTPAANDSKLEPEDADQDRLVEGKEIFLSSDSGVLPKEHQPTQSRGWRWPSWWPSLSNTTADPQEMDNPQEAAAIAAAAQKQPEPTEMCGRDVAALLPIQEPNPRGLQTPGSSSTQTVLP
mmetsp:Transcript_11819/g.21548  ORF Transcript_11819/g.21548 Transcript_11819/m.21548 type:complete len:180 (+) Transcript_11819:81-620(+)